MAGKTKDLTGCVFGRLVVVSLVLTPRPGAYWDCRCACGTHKTIRAQSLVQGATRSCGCLNNETRALLNRTHGLSKHSAYNSWESMMSRCHNPKDKDYERYHGAGITVCRRWHDVTNFVKDMGERPSGKSIDRKDGTKGYYLRNCRWATTLEQGSNRTNALKGIVNGELLHVAEAARRYSISETTLARRMHEGLSLQEAVDLGLLRVRKGNTPAGAVKRVLRTIRKA